MNLQDKPIENHEYDGIQEFDNPLPGWWLVTFYGAIIFAAIYYFNITFNNGSTLAGEFDVAWKQVQELKAANAPKTTEVNADELNAKVAEPARIADGAKLFEAKCANCHGQKGEGLVGPNLTDNAWIHGKGTPADIHTVVYNGVLDKGMLAWKDMLTPDELTNAVAFVYSLKGTNVPGKAPQGEPVQ